ncbi:hypothetical protein [Pedobacter sp. Leaf216]|uniref:hypothetical protein n=1 Tax=Pedobacter sp. Leaf216 TaxID=1735684 RepID=UPI000A67BBA6|nr:hypothetical protein [Pedobacter sp. Leaf216]
MDNKDFVFVNKTLTEKEEKEFSDFLKARKKKSVTTNLRKSSKPYMGNSTNR